MCESHKQSSRKTIKIFHALCYIFMHPEQTEKRPYVLENMKKLLGDNDSVVCREEKSHCQKGKCSILKKILQRSFHLCCCYYKIIPIEIRATDTNPFSSHFRYYRGSHCTKITLLSSENRSFNQNRKISFINAFIYHN